MRLKRARLLAELNQCQVEQRTGIAQARLSLIENGYRKPSDEEKTKLAAVLGCKVDDIDWDNPRGKREFPNTPPDFICRG